MKGDAADQPPRYSHMESDVICGPSDERCSPSLRPSQDTPPQVLLPSDVFLATSCSSLMVGRARFYQRASGYYLPGMSETRPMSQLRDD